MMKILGMTAMVAAVASAFEDIDIDSPTYFEDLPDIDLDQFEEHTFDNLVDHFNFLDDRTYKQRYWKSDQYWNGEGPIFIYICGEYRCTVPDTRLYPFMVGAQYNALFLVLEHRFYGDSQPFDDWSMESLKKLSSEQGMADLAYFLGKKNKNNVPVLVVGGSYPGALSAWFRSKYPHITIGSWASSAVVHPITDYWKYDNQIYTSTAKSGKWCPDMVQYAVDYVNQQAEIRESGDPDNFITKNLADTTVPDLRTDDWLSYFADIPAGAIQYGARTTFCDHLHKHLGKNGENIANAILNYDGGSNPADYSRSIVASTEIDVNSSGRPWNFQVCTEYGWFQTPSHNADDRMRSGVLGVDYWKQYCSDAFSGLDMTHRPRTKQTINDQGGLNIGGTDIFFANGGEDPWRWATQQTAHPELRQRSELSDCNDCGHCAELYTPKSDDPQELQHTRRQVAHWVHELLNRNKHQNHSTAFIQ